MRSDGRRRADSVADPAAARKHLVRASIPAVSEWFPAKPRLEMGQELGGQLAAARRPPSFLTLTCDR
jgi:hypothetical protein